MITVLAPRAPFDGKIDKSSPMAYMSHRRGGEGYQIEIATFHKGSAMMSVFTRNSTTALLCHSLKGRYQFIIFKKTNGLVGCWMS